MSLSRCREVETSKGPHFQSEKKKRSPSQATGCPQFCKITCFGLCVIYFLDEPFTVITQATDSASLHEDTENRLCHVWGLWLRNRVLTWRFVGHFGAVMTPGEDTGGVGEGAVDIAMKYCFVDGVPRTAPLRYIFRLEGLQHSTLPASVRLPSKVLSQPQISLLVFKYLEDLGRDHRERHI